MKALVVATLAAAAFAGAGARADASGEQTAAYQLVDSLVSQPRLLAKPWPQMRKAFPAACSKGPDAPDLTCPPMAGVRRLSATASGTGMIDLVLADPVSCEQLYEVISKRLGPGNVEAGNKCTVRWSMQPEGRRVHVRLSRGKKDPGQIHFQMAMEQGP